MDRTAHRPPAISPAARAEVSPPLSAPAGRMSSLATSSVPSGIDRGTSLPADALAVPALCSSAGMATGEKARLLLFVTAPPSEVGLQAAIDSGAGGIFLPSGAADFVGRGGISAALGRSHRAPLVAVDEEGGRVQRLAPVAGTLPSARDMASLGPAAVRRLAREHGRKLRDLGITVDFAPVLDVVDDDRLQGRDAIGDRSFSADPALVTATAGAFAAGLVDAGVMPTYKHFPGHGHASGDSHRGVVTTPALSDLEPDLVPYRQLLADPSRSVAVMVGHLVVPGLTDGEPATVSRAAVAGLLREQLGFDGLVVTDDLGAMRGILDRYGTEEAAVRAVGAGVDMVLVPLDAAERTARSLAAAVEAGRVPASQLTVSADRVLRAQRPDVCR